ncbi:hypothetical protein L484_004453 [Morus notabilis]|uniref:Uncharacterized protein n=1 Tax=Morus notabilis TaxID=981085 RepID=W9R8K5_9ROSA|nr:hypothetical protein L484_004453 [Morus notabilis]
MTCGQNNRKWENRLRYYNKNLTKQPKNHKTKRQKHRHFYFTNTEIKTQRYPNETDGLSTKPPITTKSGQGTAAYRASRKKAKKEPSNCRYQTPQAEERATQLQQPSLKELDIKEI